jgi:uncharacterized protein (DUF362 family)
MTQLAIMNSKGVIRPVLERLIPEVLPWVSRGASIFLKPNLTYPSHKPGVTTTPAFVDALLSVLRDLGVERITVGEGEGGYNAFSMSEAFSAHGSEAWKRRYGAEVATVTNWPSFEVEVRNRFGSFSAHFPKALLDEFDGVLTLPVPKVHAMTGISGAAKNQWGLVQDPMRLRLHLALSEILFQFHEQVRVGVLIDGTYGLTRNGPMIEGEALELGWAAAASNVWTADVALAGVMNFPLKRIPYLRHALKAGALVDDTSAIWRPFASNDFYLRRNLWNRAAKLTWFSPRLNHLVYFSSTSDMLHRIMYSIRHAPKVLSLRGRDWS